MPTIFDDLAPHGQLGVARRQHLDSSCAAVDVAAGGKRTAAMVPVNGQHLATSAHLRKSPPLRERMAVVSREGARSPRAAGQALAASPPVRTSAGRS